MALDDERLRQLGRVAATSAELEFYLYALTCELSGETVGEAQAAVGDRSFSQLRDLAKARAAASDLPAEAVALLEHFLGLADAAMAARGRVLHSHWVTDTTQVRLTRKRRPGVRLEVPPEVVAEVANSLDTAASGMNFAWIEVVRGLGRLRLAGGIPQLTDWTGLPAEVEQEEWAPATQTRWAHVFLTGEGALGAGGSTEPDALSAVIDDAYPSCPACGERLVDAGADDDRPGLVCPDCGLGVVTSAKPPVGGV